MDNYLISCILEFLTIDEKMSYLDIQMMMKN